MKKILIIVVTFVLAFATSALFEIEFVARHWVRTALVVALIAVELYVGFLVVRTVALGPMEEKE